jgi:integrase
MPALPYETIVNNDNGRVYPGIPEFMAHLRQQQSIEARALEFLILTGVRSGDIVGNPEDDDKPPMMWAHIKAESWTIPSTKTSETHRVPLSDQAVALLKALPTKTGPVFGVDEYAMQGVIQTMNNERTESGLPRYVDPEQGGRDIVPHGFRACFRTWAGACTSYPHEICEKAIGHKVGDDTVQAYDRGDLFEKRRRLMKDWAIHWSSQPRKTGKVGNVTNIRGVR